MSYKDTLNLPKTDFSMRANLSQLEPKMLSFWNDLDIYGRMKQQRKGSKSFILHDGPPYANGLIHIGHALNKLLKDIVLKYKALRGFNTPFTVGWDCHGLPVEHQLFKELDCSKHDVDVADFRKKAKDFALKFVDLQREDFKRLAVFSDWDKPYLTLNPEYEYAMIKLLQFLTEKGYVYRGRKPVNWCSDCETALAEAEVEYADKTSDSIFVLFKTDDKNKLLGERDVHFLVWTTTPWTLISNVAVAAHPDYKYSLVEYNDKAVLVGCDFIPVLEEKLEAKLKEIKTFKGSELEGVKLAHPFLKRNSGVVMAEFVSKEEGSGCVHIAPGHGAEDFSLTQKYDLEVIMPVNEKGIFDEPEEFSGKSISQANKAVIEVLTKNNALIKHSKIKHSYPHCWRCKSPIIFRATYQWFVNVDHDDLRKKLIDETDNVSWFPESGKERMRSMLELRPDWCLSRQRLWGVPIPAVKCKACSHVVLNGEIVGKVADIFKEKGSDSWFTEDLGQFTPKGYKCEKCGSSELEKEFDILDVWFESGASFMAVLQQIKGLSFPADMYLEGSDQHRGWFQVSLIPSVAKEGKAPYKTILTHGFVVDGEGRKMSKSIGNVIAPQKIIQKYGAEILRLWTAYSDYSEDVKISDEILKQLVDMYRKIRNTIRFTMGSIYDFDLEANKIEVDRLLEVDRYMLPKAMKLAKEVNECYDNYLFYKACQKIFNFCNLDMSSFYLDILKDRLYTFSSNSHQRRSAQFVLHHILNVLLKLIAPMLSFTAEEAYQAWGTLKDKKDSIFLSDIDSAVHSEWIDNELNQQWERIFALRDKVLKEIENVRESGQVGSALETQVTVNCDSTDFKFFDERKDFLPEVFITSKVTVAQGKEAVKVDKATGQKCPRCWNVREDVGSDTEYPELCSRCAQALKGGNK